MVSMPRSPNVAERWPAEIGRARYGRRATAGDGRLCGEQGYGVPRVCQRRCALLAAASSAATSVLDSRARRARAACRGVPEACSSPGSPAGQGCCALRDMRARRLSWPLAFRIHRCVSNVVCTDLSLRCHPLPSQRVAPCQPMTASPRFFCPCPPRRPHAYIASRLLPPASAHLFSSSPRQPTPPSPCLSVHHHACLRLSSSLRLSPPLLPSPDASLLAPGCNSLCVQTNLQCRLVS